MEKATIELLKAMKPWDKLVKKVSILFYEKYTYQGRLLSDENYLIICSASKCELIWVGQKDPSFFPTSFFVWEWDRDFVREAIIKDWQDIIDKANEVYWLK